jgi:tRNA A-37 threonylcarbamoyl transferase component Bud32
VAGDGADVGTPLRAGDPARLGEYELLRRLGEGGMGSVYLAESATGRRVALKVIREDLAEQPEFRRRFRSEVARAREVPPFCTAEVLDAAPDHEPPYLVVEYVDGPSLADVVRDRGPLTAANLHGLAIGMATALTAIHSAGVIHRDLKPSNVLLAPGAPKVIDFGIAQAVEAADEHTDTDTNQLIGTVSYMAPERLEPGIRRTLTPAADIFAWGAVVAYAATGHGAFESDSAPATAIAILTKKPDLAGIAEPLRGLVERALAKNPRARPTARDLLDELLSGAVRPGSHPDETTVHFDTDALRSGVAEAYVDVGGASPTEVVPAPRERGRWRGLGVAALVLLVVASAGALAGIISGVIRLPTEPGAQPSPSPPISVPAGSEPASVAPSGSPTVEMPAGFPFTVLRDPLTARGRWRATSDANFHISCTFSPQGLKVTLAALDRTNTWRCNGPADRLGDFQATTDVTLNEAGSCAGLWFRFQGTTAGYVLRVCDDRVDFGTHAGATLTSLKSYVFATALALGTPVRLSVLAHGNIFTVAQCDLIVDGCTHPTVLLQDEDANFDNPGTVQIGIFEPPDAAAAPVQPYQVTFADIDITAPVPPSSGPSAPPSPSNP